MKFISYSILLSFSLFPTIIFAQQSKEYVKGHVAEEAENHRTIPLIGANVYWLGTTVGATTDINGEFVIEQNEGNSKLVISYIGYQNDTVDTEGKEWIDIHLKASVTLDEVKVVRRQKSTQISYINPIKVENIDDHELLKAACCNLSESFETNPSVDVSFTDAVTGTRQIQMLGLAGPYVQITRENLPDIRGLSAIYGLTYIPGAWIESIQLNKGTGSVANGFESVTGQINVELRKPEEDDRLYLNLYGNEEGRLEANANLAHQLSEKWSTGLLLHAKDNSVKRDKNHDGFLDNPTGNNLIALHRWNYEDSNRMHFQIGMKVTHIDNIGGQTGFKPAEDALTTNKWGMHLNMQRLEGWAKLGRVFEEMPWKTVGFQLSGTSHSQDSYFGMNEYEAGQNTLYANLLYQSIIVNTGHKFRTGTSLQYDKYKESLNDSVFTRNELVPGAFFEYTYNYQDKFNAVAGIRTDYHNVYGLFITPRLHLRYLITEDIVLRASGGRGQRTASILSENNGLLASSRQIVIIGDADNKPYGLEPEVAWNYGANVTFLLDINHHHGSISFDFYRTDFKNQVIVDLDQEPQKALFYNLKGKSFSNSFQAQADYELIERLDVRLAYRWFDVRTTYSGKLLRKPLVARHRAFINTAYETSNHWKFDLTLNWQGEKRIPNTGSNPEEYRLPERSPDFILMNAQISKAWKDKFEVYAGAENLLNFKQSNPILASDQPFGPYFDSTLIWGPIFGRNIYMGIRYRIK